MGAWSRRRRRQRPAAAFNGTGQTVAERLAQLRTAVGAGKGPCISYCLPHLISPQPPNPVVIDTLWVLLHPFISMLPDFAILSKLGSCHKRQKPQAPTPLAPIRNRQTRKSAIAKGLNRNTKLA